MRLKEIVTALSISVALPAMAIPHINEVDEASRNSTSGGFKDVCTMYKNLLEGHEKLSAKLQGSDGVSPIPATDEERKIMEGIIAWDAACRSINGPVQLWAYSNAPAGHSDKIKEIYESAWQAYQHAQKQNPASSSTAPGSSRPPANIPSPPPLPGSKVLSTIPQAAPPSGQKPPPPPPPGAKGANGPGGKLPPPPPPSPPAKKPSPNENSGQNDRDAFLASIRDFKKDKLKPETSDSLPSSPQPVNDRDAMLATIRKGVQLKPPASKGVNSKNTGAETTPANDREAMLAEIRRRGANHQARVQTIDERLAEQKAGSSKGRLHSDELSEKLRRRREAMNGAADSQDVDTDSSKSSPPVRLGIGRPTTKINPLARKRPETPKNLGGWSDDDN